MRKELIRKTREHFKGLLTSELEGFSHASAASAAPGSDLYAKKIADDLALFIRLVPNPKPYRDSFMIELGWSRSKFPTGARVTDKWNIDPMQDAALRLPVLWREQWSSPLEPWWEIGAALSLETSQEHYSGAETERRLTLLPSLVKDAVEKVRQYAIPLFRTIAAARGYAKESV